MFEFFWQHIAGSGASKAMGTLKGFIKARCLPLFDLVSDLIVATSLSKAASSSEEYDKSTTLTGTREGDARWAWILLAFPWSMLIFAVALSLAKNFIHFCRTGCGKRLGAGDRDDPEARKHCCNTAGKALCCYNSGSYSSKDRNPNICFCSRRGEQGEVHNALWWMAWWWLVIFVAAIPSLLAAPFAILSCEIYMIFLHPDGSVPQNGFVASYENLREVTEALFESLPQTLFQIGLVLSPVIAGGWSQYKHDTMLVASITVSIGNAARYYMFLRKTSTAYRRPMIGLPFGGLIKWMTCNKCCRKAASESIVGELASIGDTTNAHAPFHLIMRAKPNIDFLNCGRLSEAQCYEIGEALIGNKVLKRPTFRS